MAAPTRPIILSLLAALAWFAIRPTAGPPMSAADSSAHAWGASDPSWSPDGERLAFSLFGSIWTVPADGGGADQLTASEGFHEHAAWAPDGKSVAFVTGRNPFGRFAKIRGRLAVADVETKREHTLTLPHPTAGTPDWSPDGAAIYCALAVPGAGALLHAIDPRTGQSTALHGRPQRGPAGPWAEASSASGAVIFAAQRAGTPQAWSLPTKSEGLAIHLPLTRYRPEHIVMLDGVSALADGSAILAADVINGRGNFELYRVPGTGGEPEAITDTPRHELSPDVSPDGRRIAFASNRLGNMDLFTLPLEGGEARHVRIDSLRFRRPSGKARVTILDELGQPAAARLYVEASDGKGYAPRGEPIFYYPLAPGASRDSAGKRDAFFVATGTSEFDVPARDLALTAVRGFEYRLSQASATVRAGETAEITLRLERWTNWNQRGWYSGENHFHANYLGSYYQRPQHSLAWMKAMDLNAANMIVANAQGVFVHDKEFFTGELSPLSTGRHFLYWGQEYRNSNPLGHMGFLNIKRLVPPSYTSVHGSDSPYDFPLNTTAALEAKRQGGLVTYMHPISGTLRDVFDTNLGAKEVAVTAALGALDTLDILPYGESAYGLWYTLLNCGFRISAGAGTDTFTNRRGINRIPGGSRQYVHVGSEMSWERWIKRYREGRSFATTGPLLAFDVNGSGVGEEIKFVPGTTYRATLRAEVMSRTPLERIEILRNGRVIATADANSALRFRLEEEAMVTESSWFAARVYGPRAPGLTTQALAHSSPVYVTADGRPVLVRDDLNVAVRWVDRLWVDLLERDNLGSDDNRRAAREMVNRARQHFQDKLRQI